MTDDFERGATDAVFVLLILFNGAENCRTCKSDCGCLQMIVQGRLESGGKVQAVVEASKQEQRATDVQCKVFED